MLSQKSGLAHVSILLRAAPEQAAGQAAGAAARRSRGSPRTGAAGGPGAGFQAARPSRDDALRRATVSKGIQSDQN